jgi:hypothetical protein
MASDGPHRTPHHEGSHDSDQIAMHAAMPLMQNDLLLFQNRFGILGKVLLLLLLLLLLLVVWCNCTVYICMFTMLL